MSNRRSGHTLCAIDPDDTKVDRLQPAQDSLQIAARKEVEP